MNIVVVAPRFPFSLDKGDRLTVFHLLRYFSQRHQVSFICFLETGEDPAWVDKVKPFCVRVEVVPLRQSRAYFNCLVGLLGRKSLQARYYYDPVMTQTVHRVIDEMQPNLLYAHTIRMVRCFLKGFVGDSVNLVLAAAAWNLRKWMREWVLFWLQLVPLIARAQTLIVFPARV